MVAPRNALLNRRSNHDIVNFHSHHDRFEKGNAYLFHKDIERGLSFMLPWQSLSFPLSWQLCWISVPPTHSGLPVGQGHSTHPLSDNFQHLGRSRVKKNVPVSA